MSSFVGSRLMNGPLPPAKSRGFTSIQMVHTHTRSYGAGQIRWRMTMTMKGWPTHPSKGPPGRSQRQQKKDNNNNNKEGGGGKEQGEGERTAPSGTAHHTQTQEKEGDATRKRGHKQISDAGNDQGQPWKGRKKQKANTPEGRQQKRRRWGGGRTTPCKPEEDTKDLTQPNLPGDATDQPNPNTNTHYREGPKGEKPITNQKELCSKLVQYFRLSMTCVARSADCIHSSSQLRHLTAEVFGWNVHGYQSHKKSIKIRVPGRPWEAFWQGFRDSLAVGFGKILGLRLLAKLATEWPGLLCWRL